MVCAHFIARKSFKMDFLQKKLLTRTKLPLGLLNAAQGHPMLVELKNGETLNGHLVTCDTWMNLTLKEVVQTSPVWFTCSVLWLPVILLSLETRSAGHDAISLNMRLTD